MFGGAGRTAGGGRGGGGRGWRPAGIVAGSLPAPVPQCSAVSQCCDCGRVGGSRYAILSQP